MSLFYRDRGGGTCYSDKEQEKLMSKSIHHMNRRTMLKAAGISLALPWMESLAGPRSKVPPRRFCSIYFPYGVSLPKLSECRRSGLDLL